MSTPALRELTTSNIDCVGWQLTSKWTWSSSVSICDISKSFSLEMSYKSRLICKLTWPTNIVFPVFAHKYQVRHYQILSMVFCDVIHEPLACARVRFSNFGIGFSATLAPSTPINIAYPSDIRPLMKYSEPAWLTLSNVLNPAIFPVGILCSERTPFVCW